MADDAASLEIGFTLSSRLLIRFGVRNIEHAGLFFESRHLLGHRRNLVSIEHKGN